MLKVENLSKRYQVQSVFKTKYVDALKNITFELGEGHSLAIVGESGSGKTTLARLFIGLEKPTAGAFTFTKHTDVAMVFQDNYASFNPHRTVAELIAEPLEIKGQAIVESDIISLLSELDLSPDILAKLPHQLSGGQRQRVGIARSLITKPQILILDEPVSALDVSIQAKLLKLLRQIKKEKTITYIIISHDLFIIRPLAEVTAVLYQGELIEFGPTESVLHNPQHEYTKSLIDSVPGQKRG